NIVNMFHHGGDIACSTEEAGNTADTHVSATVGDCLDHVIRFGTDMFVHRCRRRVTCHHGLAGHLRCLQPGLPSAMRHIGNHAYAVQLPNHFPAEVAESAVGGFRASVADHIATVVRQVHHADAELEEDADVAQLFLDGTPFLRQRNT